MARLAFSAGTTVASGSSFGMVPCEVLPLVTPIRRPGLPTSEIAAIGGGGWHEVSELERNQRLAEGDVSRARGRGIADREIDVARLHGFDDFGDSLKVDWHEGDAEPFCKFLAEIDAETVHFSGGVVQSHRQWTAGKDADAQLACGGQNVAHIHKLLEFPSCVPRMLRSAPPLALGSALGAARAQALWCAADPGSIFTCEWVPALRRTAEEALRRVRDTSGIYSVTTILPRCLLASMCSNARLMSAKA